MPYHGNGNNNPTGPTQPARPAGPAGIPGGGGGAPAWKQRVSQVVNPAVNMGGTGGINPMPSPQQAFQEGYNMGDQINKAVAADNSMKTVVYGSLAGSTAGRIGSGSKAVDTPDGGGCQSCGGGGGTAGGGGGGNALKSFCSVAYYHGLIPEDHIKADYARTVMFDQNTRKGYQIWSLPAARWFVKRPVIFKWSVGILAKAWSKHMAYLEGVSKTDSLLGRFLRIIGTPVCRFIGKIFGKNMPNLY